MKLSLSTVEKNSYASIEYSNPQAYGRLKPTETIEAHISYLEAQRTYANELESYPTIAEFISTAKFYVALYNQHSSRNPTPDHAPCANISFLNGVLGRSIAIAAFIQSELLTCSFSLSRQCSQIDFNIEISNETILGNIERDILGSAKNSDSECNISKMLDKFGVAFR